MRGGVVLLEHAVFNEADLGGQGHGLHLVVGDIDEGRTGLHVEALELIAHLQAQLGVQIGQGLIHEQHRRLRGQGAGDGHPLLLAAGELCGVAVHKHADLHDAGHPADGEVDLLPGELAGLGDHLAPFTRRNSPSSSPPAAAADCLAASTLPRREAISPDRSGDCSRR